MKQVINLADATLGPVGNGGKFAGEFASLGALICTRKLGVSVVVAPPGDGSTAHQIENTSAAPLRYLTFSTKLEPEVMEYPDSGKFGLSSFAGKDKPTIRYLGRTETSLDYFDGEA